jgi:hypothetical protein
MGRGEHLPCAEADLLACGMGEELTRAGFVHSAGRRRSTRLWEALARLHGQRGDLLGLEFKKPKLAGVIHKRRIDASQALFL